LTRTLTLLLAAALALAGCSADDGDVANAATSAATTPVPVTIPVTFVAASAPAAHPADVQTQTPAPATVPAASATVPLPTATEQATASFVQLTQGGCCVQPFFSPDGTRVLYLDRPSPDAPVGIWGVATDRALAPPELFSQRLGPFSRDLSLAISLEGGHTVVERLADGQRWTVNNGGRQVSFSPDATRMVWSVQEEAGGFDVRRSEIWLANVDGSEARRLAVRFGGGALAWFPDSQRLLVGGKAKRADPQTMLGILNLADGTIRDLIPVERLRSATLSPDGRWLAYYVAQARDSAQNGMYLLDLEAPVAQPRRLDFFGAYRWRDSGRLLYVPLQPGAPSNALWQFDVNTGQAEQLIAPSADSPFKIANGDWDVSPDGRRIAFLSARDRNIWLVNLP
jgi:Tol biopolymer transport system component